MSRKPQPAATGSSLRKYSSRFKGPALLVCSKCQRKLKRSGGHTHTAQLKKTLKHLSKADPQQRRLHIIGVSCLKLCPKGAVTVCTPADLAQVPPSLTLISSREDVASLYQECIAGLPSEVARSR